MRSTAPSRSVMTPRANGRKSRSGPTAAGLNFSAGSPARTVSTVPATRTPSLLMIEP